jgi:hypothetical protein
VESNGQLRLFLCFGFCPTSGFQYSQTFSMVVEEGIFFPHAWLMTAEKRNTRSFLAVKMRPVGSREERFSRSSVVGLDT